MSEAVVLPILESSQTGEARRSAIALASRLGFNETVRGKVGIVVTEIANNLVQHAREGQLLLQAIEKHNVMGIEILSLDKGPGIDNIDECLRDGFSTAGTAGNGLGAIDRLSDLFEVYSQPNRGTAIVSQIWAAPLSAVLPPGFLELGVVCLPKAGEAVPGDAWASFTSGQRSLLLVADGLGHGPLAAKASLEAVRVFEAHAHRSPKEIVELAHQALRSTRGAALAVAEVNFERQSIRFTGVGNIAASFLSPMVNYNLISHNGTVGHEARKVQEFTYQWHASGILILHSDGLSTHWQLERYPGLSYKHPSLIAGILYRDFNRDRDDLTVLVAREGQEQ